MKSYKRVPVLMFRYNGEEIVLSTENGYHLALDEWCESRKLKKEAIGKEEDINYFRLSNDQFKEIWIIAVKNGVFLQQPAVKLELYANTIDNWGFVGKYNNVEKIESLIRKTYEFSPEEVIDWKADGEMLKFEIGRKTYYIREVEI